MRVHLLALGCRLNEAELENWSRDFQARGHQIAPTLEQADLLVVNTCAVTEEAVRKSKKLLRRTHRENPAAKLVVSGCYASLEPGASDTLGADLIVGNQDKDRLVEIVSRELDLTAMPVLAREPDAPPSWPRGRQRAFVKVQDGCRYRCTFCVVTLARGEERSRPIGEVVAEINRLGAAGVQEAVLTGVHLGGYGSERGENLGHLIRAVLADTDLPRLRVGSLEPWDLPEGFWDLFAHPRVLPHLHLPLQSGSDRILRRMARRCKSQDFARLVQEGRARVADLNLTTDIIVGFPGETEADWRDTLDLVADLGFGHLHIFPFSPRQGTRAASLPDPVDPATKRARSQALHALGQTLKRATLERFLDRRLPVLVEGRVRGGEGNGHWFGYTPNFLPVRIPDPGGQDLENRILAVDLMALSPSGDAVVGRLNAQAMTQRPT